MTTLFKYDTRAPVVDWTKRKPLSVRACWIGLVLLGVMVLVAVCWPEVRQ